MPWSRHQILPALAFLCLGAMAVSYVSLQDSPAPSDTVGLPSFNNAPPPTLADSPTKTGAPVTLPDLACDFEPLHQEVEAGRKNVATLAAAVRKLRALLLIQDPDPEDAAAPATLRSDPDHLSNLGQRITDQTVWLEKKRAQWKQVLRNSVDEFTRTAPKDPLSCGNGLLFAVLRNSQEEAAKLRATGAAVNSPRLRELERQIEGEEGSLVDTALFQEIRDLAETRQALAQLDNPQKALADYLALKTAYLTAKQQLETIERRYQIARQIPLPAERTKDWRAPRATSLSVATP